MDSSADGVTVAYALEGRDLRDRRGRPVAARRARHHRRRGRDRAAGRVDPRHRGRLRRARVHRPRQPVVGSVRAGHDRRHHPGHAAAPTSPAPSSRRWRIQTRDVVEAMDAASGTRSRRAARRRRRVGDGPAAAAAGRPAPGARRPSRRRRRRLPSARPTWPGWPKGCGARSTSSPRTGTSTASSRPRRAAAAADQRYAGWKRAVDRSRT